jgi:hypothetical protein
MDSVIGRKAKAVKTAPALPLALPDRVPYHERARLLSARINENVHGRVQADPWGICPRHRHKIIPKKSNGRRRS